MAKNIEKTDIFGQFRVATRIRTGGVPLRSAKSAVFYEFYFPDWGIKKTKPSRFSGGLAYSQSRNHSCSITLESMKGWVLCILDFKSHLSMNQSVKYGNKSADHFALFEPFKAVRDLIKSNR